MEAAREHIEEIRRCKFSIGASEPNPLTVDLHHAVRNLSAELYTKDVHFVMELIQVSSFSIDPFVTLLMRSHVCLNASPLCPQNAEDNAYLEGVDPSLEFMITSNDITDTGAMATLLVFNNEVGFSRNNIESLCSVGRSTKKGRRMEGYIGEKGHYFS